jgi:hypothetical protein
MRQYLEMKWKKAADGVIAHRSAIGGKASISHPETV